MTVVAVVRMNPKADRRDALAATLAEHAVAIRAEDGCALYAVHTDGDGVVAISKWRDADALAAHAAGAPVQRLRAAIADLIATPSSIMRLRPYRPDDAPGTAI